MTSAIEGVLREAVIAACLTALMILLFLGSWRSTVIIAISIPLSILSSIIVLSSLGETINIMTLGGLALAVGILVDDATVEIENVNRNLDEGKPVEKAILDGASQIAVPAFVSTLCICIVFVPIFFLSGTAKYLFTPLAEAVIFAMLASYFLSRTLVPTLAKYLLVAQQPHLHGANPTGWRQSPPNENEELFPGAYGQITLKLEANTNTVVIPSNTLLFRSDGTTVGVVKPDGTVEIRKIVINQDLGSKLEVSEGLTENEQLIVNPSDGLADEMAVKIATPKKPTATAAGSSSARKPAS